MNRIEAERRIVDALSEGELYIDKRGDACLRVALDDIGVSFSDARRVMKDGSYSHKRICRDVGGFFVRFFENPETKKIEIGW